MKLTEMNTDQLADLYVLMAPALENITSGEHWDEIANAVRGATTGRLLTAALPLLLKYNRKDLYTIIGAANGKSAAEIAKQPSAKTLAEARDLFASDIGDFLSPSVSAEHPA